VNINAYYGGEGEGILYKEMTGHELDDRISNPVKRCIAHTKTRGYSASYPINVVNFDFRIKLLEHEPNQQLSSISDFTKEWNFLSVNPNTYMSLSLCPETLLFYIYTCRHFL
jgi:hypothetical protein